ncbi:MAG TPA: competence-specific regulator, partial [Gammaproteobacteria bacterium]|nr:competence-specific regulator [Gammaproteobacteria bacterium]
MPPGQPLRTLKNLGPCSEALLSAAGIDTVEDLKAVGAMGAYLRVIHTQAGAPSR